MTLTRSHLVYRSVGLAPKYAKYTITVEILLCEGGGAMIIMIENWAANNERLRNADVETQFKSVDFYHTIDFCRFV